MATLYDIKLTSHWVNYNEKELERKLNELLKEDRNNEWSVEVERKNRI